MSFHNQHPPLANKRLHTPTKPRHRLNGVGRGGGQAILNQILTRFRSKSGKSPVKSGQNPLKSDVFRCTRRTPTVLKKWNPVKIWSNPLFCNNHISHMCDYLKKTSFFPRILGQWIPPVCRNNSQEVPCVVLSSRGHWKVSMILNCKDIRGSRLSASLDVTGIRRAPDSIPKLRSWSGSPLNCGSPRLLVRGGSCRLEVGTAAIAHSGSIRPPQGISSQTL